MFVEGLLHAARDMLVTIADDTKLISIARLLTARAVLRALLSDAEYEEAQLVDYVKGVGYR
jgi:hypothetical protein